MPSVIGKEKYDRILGQTKFFKLIKHSSNTIISTLNHSSVRGIAMAIGDFLFLIFFLELGFGLNRGVYRIMSKVKKEWIIFIFFNKFAGFLAKTVGKILALFFLL
jgi:hypothetical protein